MYVLTYVQIAIAHEHLKFEGSTGARCSRHFGSSHFGSSHFGSSRFGSTHFGSRHSGSRHLGSRHFGSRHSGSRHFVSRHLGSRHFGSRHFGRGATLNNSKPVCWKFPNRPGLLFEIPNQSGLPLVAPRLLHIWRSTDSVLY